MSFEEPRFVKKKISSDSPGYQEELTERSIYASEEEQRIRSSFGVEELNRIYYAERTSKAPGVERSTLDAEVAEASDQILRDSMARFAALCADPAKEEAVSMFLEEALENEEVAKAVAARTAEGTRQVETTRTGKLLRAIFGDEAPPEPEWTKLLPLVTEGTLSPQLWKQMLTHHIERHKEALERFDQGTTEALKKDFMDRALPKLGTDLLPISEERLRTTLDRVLVSIQDGLTEEFQDALGTFDPSMQEILIISYLFSEKRESYARKVFVHEAVHALAGVTALENTDEADDPEDDFVIRDDMRTGTFFHTGIQRMKHPRFRWLNEALTEVVTQGILGSDAPYAAYPRERALLDHLMHGGSRPIPLRTFTDAYFEHYDREARPTIPHWRALREALNESFGPTFLMDLDKKIQENGIDGVLAEHDIVLPKKTP